MPLKVSAVKTSPIVIKTKPIIKKDLKKESVPNKDLIKKQKKTNNDY